MAIVIEALAEKAISSLLEAVTSLLREKVDLILNAEDELKKLQRKLERLEVSLKDVDRKPFFSSERDRLDAIKKDWEMVDLLKTTPNRRFEDPVHGEHDNSRGTTHHMGAQPPIGREDDKREIVKRLLSHESAHSSMTKKGSVSIISIVGKGGIGKTTLAKMVLSEIAQQFGERRWWVCVSERPKRKDLVRQILRKVCNGYGENTDCTLDGLCTKLWNELSKEKFLLVLDDVWELNWWEEEQSWDLFIKEALREGEAERDLENHNVRDVGESIVKKCGGLPLVIKTVGSMMRTKQMSREDWKSVKDSKIWEWKRQAASTSSSTEICGDILPELPKEMGELCNLRHLGLKGTKRLKFIVEGLGKLTNLRTLHRFMICNDKRKRRGSNIRELKVLKKLKGELSIEGLGRSRKAIDHVGNAQLLKEKHGIISVEFHFGIIGGDDEQVVTTNRVVCWRHWNLHLGSSA
ncbi:putative disease resistance protein RGA1 [Nymphaea colorata]|uniref:putative disease resistance protein RGA1 n=1 Tax=Nymphaea colorata TaxID=210225 RepID=UPI00214EF3DF|nr:putative disease resistance protein RGA1 [Nymphaea colorata]